MGNLVYQCRCIIYFEATAPLNRTARAEQIHTVERDQARPPISYNKWCLERLREKAATCCWTQRAHTMEDTPERTAA